MNLKTFQAYLHQKLSAIYTADEIRNFYFLLLEFYAKKTKVEVLLSPDFELSERIKTQILSASDRLITQEPIQYILGETEFFGNRFLVDRHVLIPRQETEELVDWILTSIPQNKAISILDIGCGSGAIAISLAKALPKSKVEAWDISEEALVKARENALLNQVTICLSQVDILHTQKLTKKYDVIVSNPPYVRYCEKQEMQRNVLDYEPHLALFVSDENPLIFYQKITELAKKSLNDNGQLFFEINQYLSKDTLKMLENKDFKPILRNDLNGNPRMIRAVL
ncbi:peptide chain release factor N(5)-glutamine methyltransferase [Capnocytophaga canimorsus]|uniref:peptide chain release factor N(5)-glutamine methyltransferase n=1 Tax=Capnocytophaga canimorsus TaxID=28188 RepID=UPI000D6E473B|nr:peptide chain release factor N(5)-glutamine methyltransferase [Capnocytophaga canimorsus]AWL78185.1 peptide chain release factor N(5)-glutamine methyltransferase [Capnocytophaga canimorsus]AYW36818.1 peptide chain release factor N(5)-glutamine methyltransferase [Capnocytophaga canimorsus]MDT9499508.1 peptide chain release factor N(5)-glutamine methyltransferase [Capnocytophaga canimorsus]